MNIFVSNHYTQAKFDPTSQHKYPSNINDRREKKLNLYTPEFDIRFDNIVIEYKFKKSCNRSEYRYTRNTQNKIKIGKNSIIPTYSDVLWVCFVIFPICYCNCCCLCIFFCFFSLSIDLMRIPRFHL